MTVDQVLSSNDVGGLYDRLRTAKESGDRTLIRAIEARMRHLSGANTKNVKGGKAIALDPNAALIVSPGEGGGSA